MEESKKWVLSPERKAPQKEREYAAARLDGVIGKIKNTMQTAFAKIQKALMQPETKRAGKERIKEKARESIREQLKKAQEEMERRGRYAPQTGTEKAGYGTVGDFPLWRLEGGLRLDVFEAVKQAVTTRQAAEHYGIHVGRNGMACCPFHKDKTPSLKADRRFHCFGCQADGDVIDFAARLFDLSGVEAAKRLAADFGIPYDNRGRPSPKL